MIAQCSQRQANKYLIVFLLKVFQTFRFCPDRIGWIKELASQRKAAINCQYSVIMKMPNVKIKRQKMETENTNQCIEVYLFVFELLFKWLQIQFGQQIVHIGHLVQWKVTHTCVQRWWSWWIPKMTNQKAPVKLLKYKEACVVTYDPILLTTHNFIFQLRLRAHQNRWQKVDFYLTNFFTISKAGYNFLESCFLNK